MPSFPSDHFSPIKQNHLENIAKFFYVIYSFIKERFFNFALILILMRGNTHKP